MLYKLYSPGRLGQWIVAIVAAICTLTSGQGFAWPTPALPMIVSGEAGFTMTSEEISLMVIVSYIANIASPIPAGYVMDAIGRKNTLLISILAMISCWIITYFSVTPAGLYSARLLFGIWGGVVYTVLPALIGEVVEPKIRGSMTALFAVFMFIGALFETLAGMGDYRTLSAISTIPPLILLIGFLFLPESPYYYLLKGKRDKAKESIIWLTGNCSEEKLDFLDKKVKQQLSTRGSFFDFFTTKATRKALIIVEVICVVQRGTGLVLIFSYLSLLLPNTRLNAQQSFILIYFACSLFSFFSTFFMDRFARRAIMIMSCTGVGLAMLGAGIWYYLRDQANLDMSETQWMPLFFITTAGIFYSVGLATVPQAIQGELYPVNLKGKGSALACMTSSLTSIVTLSVYLPLNNYFGIYSNFLICVFSCVFGIIFTLTSVVETKGKSLEEIQDMLNGLKVQKQ